MPVVATQLFEQYEKQGNQTTLVYERIGAHLRRSDGSQYIRLMNVVGQMPEGATIVDRESWRISPSGPSHPGGEIWAAPSLNFLVVDAKIEQGNKETINLLQNIQAGREPDPIFFQVPKDFQAVK